MSSVGACKACGIEFGNGITMMACLKCNKAHYCSADCMLWDWDNGGHKRGCEGADGASLETTNTFEDTESNSVDAFSILSGESGSILAALKAVRGIGSPIRINISSMQQQKSSPGSPNQFPKVRNKVQPISPRKAASMQQRNSDSSSTGSALLKAAGEEKKEESAEKRTPFVKHKKSSTAAARTVDTTETEGDFFFSQRMQNNNNDDVDVEHHKQASFERAMENVTFEQPDTHGFPTTTQTNGYNQDKNHMTVETLQDDFFFSTPQPDAENPEGFSNFLSTRTPHSRPSSITPTIDETLQFNGQTPTPFANQVFSFNQNSAVSNNSHSQPARDDVAAAAASTRTTSDEGNDNPESSRTVSSMTWDPSSDHPPFNRTTSTNSWDPTNGSDHPGSTTNTIDPNPGSTTTARTSFNTWDSNIENATLARNSSTNTWDLEQNPLAASALSREKSTNTWEPQLDPFEQDDSEPPNPPDPERTSWSWSAQDNNNTTNNNNTSPDLPRQSYERQPSSSSVRIHRTVPLETAFDRWTPDKSLKKEKNDDDNEELQPVVDASKEHMLQVRSSPPSNSFLNFKSISDDPNSSTTTLEQSHALTSEIEAPAAPTTLSDPIDTRETPRAANRQRATTDDFASSSISLPERQNVDRSFPSMTDAPQLEMQHQKIEYQGLNMEQLVYQPHKALLEEPQNIVTTETTSAPSSGVEGESEPEIVVASFPYISFLQEETERDIVVTAFPETTSTPSGFQEESEPDIVVAPLTPSTQFMANEESEPDIAVAPWTEAPSTQSMAKEESEPDIVVAPLSPMAKEGSEPEIAVAPISMTKSTPTSEESNSESAVAGVRAGKPSDGAGAKKLSPSELPVNLVRSVDGTVHKHLVLSVGKSPGNAFNKELRKEPTKRFQNYRKFLDTTRSEGGEVLMEHYIGSSLKAASTCTQINVVRHAPREENERDSTATTEVSCASSTESDEEDEILNKKLNSYLGKVSSGSKKAPAILTVPEPPKYASSASESEVQHDDIEVSPHPLHHQKIEAAAKSAMSAMSVPVSLPKTDRAEHAPSISQKSAPPSPESSVDSYDPENQDVVVEFGSDVPASRRYEQQKSLEEAIKGDHEKEVKQDTFVYYQLTFICLALLIGAVVGVIRNIGGGESAPAITVLTGSPVEPPSAAPSLRVFVPTSSPSSSPTSSLAPSISPTESIPTLPTPTVAPTDVPLIDILRSKSTDNGASLEDSSSSQYRAFQWLSNNTGLEDFSDEVKIQRYALATLYFSTEGDSWYNNSGWLSDDSECTWFSKSSVFPTCRLDVFVTLELNQNGLQGSIPPELGLLTKLERAELRGDSDRFMAGTLPSEVAMMTRLDSLVVTGNRLTGEIPVHLGRLNLLRRLDLSQNNFVGQIPSELADMISLTDLSLGSNQLTGTFPPELGDLENLLSLSLGVNMLTGEIPEEIGHLQELHYLYLELNRFTRMPTDLGLLSKLIIFTAADNNIEESIPSELGNMASLSSLILRGNNLNSLIPGELGNLANKLVHLDLSSNALSGPIPTEFGLLTELRTLELQENFLTGRVPSVLSQLVTLDELRLESNTLDGAIPAELCDAFYVSPFMFFSDCDIEIDCTCCTHCCSDDQLECSCMYVGTDLEFLCGDV